MTDCRLEASCLFLFAYFFLLMQPLQFASNFFGDLLHVYADGRLPAVLLLFYLDTHEKHVEALCIE